MLLIVCDSIHEEGEIDLSCTFRGDGMTSGAWKRRRVSVLSSYNTLRLHGYGKEHRVVSEGCSRFVGRGESEHGSTATSQLSMFNNKCYRGSMNC